MGSSASIKEPKDSSKRVFRRKKRKKTIVEQYKARLVARRYAQKPRLDMKRRFLLQYILSLYGTGSCCSLENEAPPNGYQGSILKQGIN